MFRDDGNASGLVNALVLTGVATFRVVGCTEVCRNGFFALVPIYAHMQLTCRLQFAISKAIRSIMY
jgi:hypothetical protein